MIRNRRGFTLVEMLVTMAVFVVVIAIVGDSFNSILKHTSKLFRSEESNIEGMVGLEMLRHDLQQAGYGLYNDRTGAPTYAEAAAVPASTYNDATDNVPRPFVFGNDIAAITDTSADTGAPRYDLLAGSDYLTVKATNVLTNAASQKWTYLKYSTHNVFPNVWRSSSENLLDNDRVVLLRRQTNTTGQTIWLAPTPAGNFYYAYSDVAFSHLTSATSGVYSVYGLLSRSSSSSGPTPRMPFNRSDYFVARPQDSTAIPSVCAPNTGVLYKTTLNNIVSSGRMNYVPLLDCVANMQVVLGWDIDGDAVIDTYSNADGSQVAAAGSAPAGTVAQVQAALSQSNNNTASTVPNIRNSLKMVKVYILAQQGRRDPGYTSPSPVTVGDPGETALTRSVDIAAAGWQNYHWKLYRIIGRPKNLPANQ